MTASLKSALREAVAQHGASDPETAVQAAALHLCGKRASDDALEAMRAMLWPIWHATYETARPN